MSDFYKTDEIITQLGTGEALITALNEKGIPTPLAATMLRAPMSRMDILTPDEISAVNASSKLVKKYAAVLDRESAYEILCKKIEAIEAQEAQAAQQKAEEKVSRTTTSRSQPSIGGEITKSVIKVATSATFIRGVFGVLNKMFKK